MQRLSDKYFIFCSFNHFHNLVICLFIIFRQNQFISHLVFFPFFVIFYFGEVLLFLSNKVIYCQTFLFKIICYFFLFFISSKLSADLKMSDEDISLSSLPLCKKL